MGSSPTHQQYDPTLQATLIEQNGSCRFYQNDKGQQFEKYNIINKGSINFENSYEYRYNNSSKELVNLLYYQPKSNVFGCTNNSQYDVVIQRIPYRLKYLNQLELKNSISILYTSLKGYKQLFKLNGILQIKDTMIGLNQKQEIKVWLNSNFAINESQQLPISLKNLPEQKRQKEIINNIIQLINSKSQQHPLWKQLIHLKENKQQQQSYNFNTTIKFIQEFCYQYQIPLSNKVIDPFNKQQHHQFQYNQSEYNQSNKYNRINHQYNHQKQPIIYHNNNNKLNTNIQINNNSKQKSILRIQQYNNNNNNNNNYIHQNQHINHHNFQNDPIQNNNISLNKNNNFMKIRNKIIQSKNNSNISYQQQPILINHNQPRFNQNIIQPLTRQIKSPIVHFTSLKQQQQQPSQPLLSSHNNNYNQRSGILNPLNILRQNVPIETKSNSNIFLPQQRFQSLQHGNNIKRTPIKVQFTHLQNPIIVYPKMKKQDEIIMKVESQNKIEKVQVKHQQQNNSINNNQNNSINNNQNDNKQQQQNFKTSILQKKISAISVQKNEVIQKLILIKQPQQIEKNDEQNEINDRLRNMNENIEKNMNENIQKNMNENIQKNMNENIQKSQQLKEIKNKKQNFKEIDQQLQKNNNNNKEIKIKQEQEQQKQEKNNHNNNNLKQDKLIYKQQDKKNNNNIKQYQKKYQQMFNAQLVDTKQVLYNQNNKLIINENQLKKQSSTIILNDKSLSRSQINLKKLISYKDLRKILNQGFKS